MLEQSSFLTLTPEALEHSKHVAAAMPHLEALAAFVCSSGLPQVGGTWLGPGQAKD